MIVKIPELLCGSQEKRKKREAAVRFNYRKEGAVV